MACKHCNKHLFMLTCSDCIHTHTHTHTQRERERTK